jgi:hypothetical protein
MGEIITIVVSSIVGGGIVGTLNWWITRKSKAKEAESNAELMRVNAEKEEFHFWEERCSVAENHNMQLTERMHQEMERYHEQTLLVREQNRQLLERADIIADLKEEISALKAERAMKLCERKGCQQRQPQSGY